MHKVLFVSERFGSASILAASFFNKIAFGIGKASCAFAGGISSVDKGANLHKTLIEADLEIPPVIEPDEFVVFNYDLIVCLGIVEDYSSSYPPLPGIPPLLNWQCSEELAGTNYLETLKTVRPLVETLTSQGYLAAMVRSRTNLEMVLDNLQEGIIAHDVNRRIFFFNKAAEKISGYRREDVLGCDCHLVFPGNFCGGKCSFCDKGCFPELPEKSYSLLFKTADGEERQLEMSVTGINDYSGKLQGVVASFRDFSRELALAERLGEIEQFSGIIGQDSKIREIFQTIRQLADSNVPVLITGESGTGKELVAAAIHNEGIRGDKLLVPVNCGALPDNLLESELFGHVRGAFTGAIRDKKGRFELADGGTLFLDEIGDISPAMQVKLLRVLQNGTFQRIGGEKTIRVDVRVISATNKDLREEILAGRFREDLFYRLCVAPIVLPALRDRRNDIPLLVEHFIKQVAKEQGCDKLVLSSEVMDVLVSYDWPGNIRELQNVIRYLMVRCREKMARAAHLPENLQAGLVRSEAGGNIPLQRKRKKLTVESVQRALLETGNNRSQAAKILGVGRATLYRFFSANPDKF